MNKMEKHNKITKEEKIKYLIYLFKRSDEEYVDDVFQLLLREDLTSLPNVLGDDDWEALKTMIWNGDIE